MKFKAFQLLFHYSKLFIRTCLLLFSSVLAFKAWAQTSQAELNAYQLSLAAAGAGANFQDPSILFYNPAGLVNFPTRVVSYSTIAAFERQHINGTANWQDLSNPLNYYQESGSTSSHKERLLPSFNEAIPFTKNFALGLGVEFPYGYNADWNNHFNRYIDNKNSLLVMDVTPNFAYRINPHLAVGAGLDADYANAKYNVVVGVPNVTLNWDSLQENTGHGWGFGGHFGVLYHFQNNANIGATYYTPVSIKLRGQSRLSGPLTQQNLSNTSIENSDLENTLHLPAVINLSGFTPVNSQWDALSSLSFTHWSSVHDVTLSPTIAQQPYQSAVLTSTTFSQNLENVWRLSLGGIYHWTPKFELHSGLAILNSPFARHTNSLLNTDNDSFTMAVGGHYQFNTLWSFDVGYAHRFCLKQSNLEQQTQINSVQLASLQGDLKSHEDLVGLQINWNIGAMKRSFA